MSKDHQRIPIADLVPYERGYTQERYEAAKADLDRDGRFTEPVLVFKVNGYSFARDKTHHIKAALERGWTEVPFKDTDSPGDVRGVRENLEDYLKHKGFIDLPELSDDKARGEAAKDPKLQVDEDALMKTFLDIVNAKKAKPTDESSTS